jgi:hypothetical protein
VIAPQGFATPKLRSERLIASLTWIKGSVVRFGEHDIERLDSGWTERLKELAMKYFVALALAATLILPVQAEERPVISQPYAPRLGDIMGMTQLRHFKLWYAGREKNWNLARYELGQIRASFGDATTYYPGLPVSDMTTMAKPSALIDAAIQAKDEHKFAQAFGQLTAACDSCHKAQGYGFIVVKVPTASPFNNEVFGPQ